MKKLICFILLALVFSAICFAYDFLELGGTLIWNCPAISDRYLGGGVNFAIFPPFTDSFGLGIFINFASGGAFLFDFMIGPYFGFQITEKFSLLVSVGGYLGMIFFGGGGGITVQYAFHKDWSVYARVQCAYAKFLAPGTNGAQSLIVSPCIGIGYRW